jgi:hypothetical protein
MRGFAIVIATLLVSGAAVAQVGGNTVSKATTANTLGYLQFVTPPPSPNLLSTTAVCRNWQFPSFGQAASFAGGYAVLYDAAGRPHYLLAC